MSGSNRPVVHSGQALGSKIGVMLQCTSSLCAGLLIVCILCRKAAIVPICAIPLIAAIGYLESKAIVSLAAAEMQATDKSNKVIYL